MTRIESWGILLAAGTSQRMGRHKLLLDFGGEPLVRRAARALLACELAGVLVVTGRDPQGIQLTLAGLQVSYAHNSDFEWGELPSSIATGLRSLPTTATGALLMLADMPFVGSTHLNRVLERIRQGHPTLSRYGSVTAPPHYVPRIAFEVVLREFDTGTPKTLPRMLASHACYAEQPEADLIDVDDELALSLALKRLTAASE
ncbi:nucleotidyltransferase family protein [Deinococcus oregonensis]|uniref:Nucleotidyltransferase family protein n=1 Tax=Deinococcus oregonensis TaxID=1805970 RepID=A0ABV6B193_9DEIO